MYEYLFGPPVVLAFGLCIGLYGYLVRVHQWTWLIAGSHRTALSDREISSIVGGCILALGAVITAYGSLFQTTSINSVWITHSFTAAVALLTLRALYRLTVSEPVSRQEPIAPADD